MFLSETSPSPGTSSRNSLHLQVDIREALGDCSWGGTLTAWEAVRVPATVMFPHSGYLLGETLCHRTSLTSVNGKSVRHSRPVGSNIVSPVSE